MGTLADITGALLVIVLAVMPMVMYTITTRDKNERRSNDTDNARSRPTIGVGLRRKLNRNVVRCIVQKLGKCRADRTPSIRTRQHKSVVDNPPQP